MTTLAMRKPHGDRAIEGLMAKWYASNTADMMNQYEELAQRISAMIPEGSAVLEIAPGPGYFNIELAKRGPYRITGLDISRGMVQIATRKARESGVQVRFEQGSASNMPYPAGSFDFLLCRAAFKNFARPVDALREMSRVLRPGARGVIIDLNRNAAPAAIEQGIDEMGLGRLNKLFTRLVFKGSLVRNAYSREEFQQMLWEASISSYEIREDGMGFEVWMTK